MKLRTVLRIARWEVTKNAGGVDRKTVVVAAVALLGVGLIAPYAATQGVALDSGIYRVGVDQDSPYYEVVDADPTFAVHEPSREAFQNGETDLLIQGVNVFAAGTAKGSAAADELRESAKQYNDRQMLAESNQSAAFPVSVSLQYVKRSQVQDVIAPSAEQEQGDGPRGGPTPDGETGDGTDGTGTDAGGDAETESGTADSEGTTAEAGVDTATDGGTDGGDGDEQQTEGGDRSVDDTETVAADGTDGTGGNGDGATDDKGSFADRLTGDTTSGAPGDIAPPFPFKSLVLAFLFVLPLNFIIQAYGSTMLSERLNRRGELLLVSPVSRFDIIGGKTLPYLGVSVGIAALIAAALELPGFAPWSVFVSVMGVLPIALLFLSATFLGAMFARSFKELTFVTVTITVSLTSYAFVPAIFTDVGAIALISPLTIVVRNLQDQTITLGEFAFSTIPPTLAAGVLFALGAGLYREEDMFTQRAIPLKVLDALAARVFGKWSVAAVSALLLPFVFVTELVGVAMLFAIPEALSVPTILVLVAVVEEVAKSLHVYAGYAHSRFEAGVKPAIVLGAFSGAGFFVGEKITLLAQLVGLPELTIGRAALVTGTGSPALPVAIALLFAPLVLHVVTGVIGAVGASRDRQSYGIALAIAIAIHFAYNFTVVNISGLL